VSDSTFFANAAQGGPGPGGPASPFNPLGAFNGSGFGGAIFSRNGAVGVSDSTFFANAADQGGGLYAVGDGVPVGVAVNNTVLAGTAGGSDFQATAINGGTFSVGGAGDLVQGPGTGVGQFPASAVVSGADPRLGPLQDNGGPTPTLARSRAALCSTPASTPSSPAA
jgi:hypothetical protein